MVCYYERTCQRSPTQEAPRQHRLKEKDSKATPNGGENGPAKTSRQESPGSAADFGLRFSVISPGENATCSRCPGALVSVLSLYYVTCECTTDRFGRKVEYASTGGCEVHPAALIFTACSVQAHMRNTGAAPCPVEGETEARGQLSVPFSLCRSATTLQIFPVGCYGYVHACRE